MSIFYTALWFKKLMASDQINSDGMLELESKDSLALTLYSCQYMSYKV